MIRSLDFFIIKLCRRLAEPLSRLGLFTVFFWFGALKVLDLSPASPLVQSLFETTMPVMPFSVFMVLFGLLEMLIGIMFLIRGAERAVIPVLFFHMTTTLLPLFLLQSVTWSGFLVPTLEGQYIIKNILIIAAAIGIAAHLHPFKKSNG
ncbi:MAG: hypothetical protein NTV02_00495 [Candidatus Zambryskibacteria bacterium]|nr:hypothetical protein [Candidatus Zambryskibacteria bacterium]